MLNYNESLEYLLEFENSGIKYDLDNITRILEELDNPQLAQSLAKDAGLKILMLNSAHNVSKDDLKAGITYEQIMRNNLKELVIGLKCQ